MTRGTINFDLSEKYPASIEGEGEELLWRGEN